MLENSLQTLGRYTIHAELGKGGFATVYRATDTLLERDVALKILKPGWTDDAKAVERFMREAKQASRLDHPGIVTIYDVGEAEGRLYIAMKLLPGQALDRLIKSSGPLTWDRTLAIMMQVAEALDYAHAQSLVHRDVKPANLIVGEKDHTVLTDFGLVRGAEQASLSTGTTGGILGTPEYIPPEVWEGQPATKASDIYSLACVLYEMLFGRPLFAADTGAAVMRKHVLIGPEFPATWPPNIPNEVPEILRKALAHEASERYATAGALISALRESAGVQEARRKMQEEEERRAREQQVREATRLAAEAAAVEVRRSQQEAERKTQEEADRQAHEEQERQRQAKLVAQIAGADKAKQEAAERERQRQVAQAAAIEKSKREVEEHEQVTHQQLAANLSTSGSLLRLTSISKRFPGVLALRNVHLEVQRGEVHALLGENGSGKSTLMKILSGIYTKDTGDISWEGYNIEIRTPKDSQDVGIAMVYQEPRLIPQLSIAENVWLRREPFRNRAMRLIDWNEMHRRTRELFDDLNLNLDPKQPAAGLSVAQRQMLEIARALSLNAKLVIMDEPTSALVGAEIDQLYGVIQKLKTRGMSVIFIPHHIVEVFRVCNRATVLRDGANVTTVDLTNTTEDQLAQLMLGRALEKQYPKVPAQRGEEALRVEGLTRKGVFHDVSFSAYAGEILGIAGQVGAGRTELMRAIFGVDPCDRGKVFVFGKDLVLGSPRMAIQAGMGFLPEDRRRQGLVLNSSVLQNVNMASLDRLEKGGLLQPRKEKDQANEFIAKLHIVTSNVQQEVRLLNDENQQKIVLAKWLASKSRILIFDEPTRGLDVDAKVELYDLMNMLVKNGAAVIMVSSDMPELLGMSDRILAMRQGRLAVELNRAEATQEKIRAATMEAN